MQGFLKTNYTVLYIPEIKTALVTKIRQYKHKALISKNLQQNNKEKVKNFVNNQEFSTNNFTNSAV